MCLLCKWRGESDGRCWTVKRMHQSQSLRGPGGTEGKRMKDLRWLEENCPYIYKRGGFANRQDTVCRPSAIRSAHGTITPFSPIPTSAQPPSSVAAAKTPASAKASRGVPSPESEASAHASVSASAAPASAAQPSAAAGDKANLWTSAVAAAREQQSFSLALVTASARSERSDRNADANAMIQDDQQPHPQKQPDGEPRPLGIPASTKRDDRPSFDVPALVEALKVGIQIRPLTNVRLAAFLRGAEEGSPVFFFRGGSIAFSSQLRGVAGVCVMSEGQLVLVGGAEASLCSEGAMQALASCGRPIVPCFSSGMPHKQERDTHAVGMTAVGARGSFVGGVCVLCVQGRSFCICTAAPRAPCRRAA